VTTEHTRRRGASSRLAALGVRRQYFRLALRALREGRLAWLARTGAKALSVPLSDRLHRPLTGPLMVNLVPTFRCNNACFMCDLPKPHLYAARGAGCDGHEYDTSEWRGVIDQVAELGAGGLSFAGGEPTVRKDCFELLRHAVDRGLLVHLNTNAYNLHLPGRVEALLDTGIASMNISLDAATPALHDRLRDARGGFDRIEQVTREVLRRRRRGRPSLTYTFVVGPDNHDEVPAFVELARARGVDSVSFNPIAGCYEGATPPSPERLAAMDRTVAWLREEKARHGGEFFDNSDAYLALFPAAFRAQESPLVCYVGYHNLVIDCYGNLYSCTLLYQDSKPSGNLYETSLRDFWTSREYQQRREELKSCKACFWNCHTELNLLYQRPTLSG
jgi:MoaA/NifB/PqqE/SkfB family radical SAM enzyme